MHTKADSTCWYRFWLFAISLYSVSDACVNFIHRYGMIWVEAETKEKEREREGGRER